MQQLQRFEERCGIMRAGHAVAREQRIAERVSTRERTGMRHRQRSAFGRSAGLQGDEWDARRPRGEASLGETRDRAEAF